MTELVVELGAGRAIVGVTRWCVRPQGLRGRPDVTVVGGTKDPDVGRILALRPDLVLASREENEREHVEALREALPVLVTDVRSVRDAAITVRAVGEALGRAPEAAAIAGRIEAVRARAAARGAGREPVPFVALVWRRPWMAAGPDTYLSDLLVTAGGRNAVADPSPRYPVLDEPSPKLAGRLVVLPSEPYPFAGRHAAGIEALGGRPVLADGELLTWYGARTARGIEHAAEVLGGGGIAGRSPRPAV